MRLSAKQAAVMLVILQEACRVKGGMAGYSHEQLQELVNEIINQQSNEPLELDE